MIRQLFQGLCDSITLRVWNYNFNTLNFDRAKMLLDFV